MAICKNVKVEEKQFTRDDIKAGYVVKLRNGELRMVVPIGSQDALIVTNGRSEKSKCSWRYLSNWNDDLTASMYHFAQYIHTISSFEELKNDTKRFDIMKVFGYVRGTENYHEAGLLWEKNRPLLWERKESKKMTVAEIEKELGYSVEIVAEK